MGFSLFRCMLRATCLVLSLNIIDWSLLPKLSIGSFCNGAAMCVNTALPVVPKAHWLNHSIFELDLIICLHVAWETGLLGCSFEAPFLARASAFSFPFIWQWLGIHWKITSCSNFLMNESNTFDRSWMTLDFGLSLSRAWRTDLASVKITKLL